MSLRLLTASPLFALCLAVPSCTGGQTGDEGALTDGTEFHGSQCPKFAEEDVIEGLSVAALSSEYDGLACLSWARQDDGGVAIELSNVEGPCLVEVDWRHRVASRDGVIELVASGEPECRIAACGSCVYDFDFELPKQRAGEPLRVSFALELCEKLEEPWLSVTLPVDTEPRGVVCKQISAGTQSWLGHCGGTHQPCGDPESGLGCDSTDGGVDACQEGLTCEPRQEAWGGLCLTPCESDADCPLRDVETCEDGLCRVPETF